MNLVWSFNLPVRIEFGCKKRNNIEEYISENSTNNINTTKNKFVNGLLSDDKAKSKDYISKYQNKSSFPVK